MPDPVSNQPSSRGSTIIECEPVPVGPETESASDFECYEAEPEPGVKALVERQKTPLRTEIVEHARVPVDIPYVEVLHACLAKAIGVQLAIENGGPLGVFKSSLEFSMCVGDAIDKVSTRAGILDSVEDCESHGGVATGVILGEVQCLGPGTFR